MIRIICFVIVQIQLGILYTHGMIYVIMGAFEEVKVGVVNGIRSK
ncbi:MAG: hypothetical protein E7L17_04540 [Clostridium sp.]|nr:hypothetical protein [Clostridium sp.]MDU7337364.1 hypothetical protein [Clostridium sp.]